MADSLPPHYGITFTPTIHSDIPSNLSPSSNTVPKPHVAVVTGAGKGLGYHIALSFARAGATGICISSRTLSDLDALSADLLSINPSIQILRMVCDTQDATSVASMADSVQKQFGRVDSVIANAGVISQYVQPPGDTAPRLPIGLLEDDDWNRVLDINLAGTWRVAKAFTPLLLSSEGGAQTLIVITSIAAHSIESAWTSVAYNVSKLAMCRLVEHIWNDHGPQRNEDEGGAGIRAYALHPGAVLTPQTQNHTGEIWGPLLKDDVGLAGAFCVWLAREKRDWLGGRYISCNWDVEELESMKTKIVEGNLLKFRMAV